MTSRLASLIAWLPGMALAGLSGTALAQLPGSALTGLPSVASINLCTDQLVLDLAEPGQILSLSWLAADPEESMLADRARTFPLNYGSAEELVGIGADVVIAGSQTSPFTRSLLRRLGAQIVEIEPAASLDDVARNLRAVGAAVGRSAEAEAEVAAMRARIAAIAAQRDGRVRSAVVVRPGGFTIGRNTLAHEIIGLAGLENVVAALDRWGSLTIETLLTTDPEIIVVTSYRRDEASLANRFLSHLALAATAETRTRIEVPARYFACGAPASLDAVGILIGQMAAP